MVTKHIKTCKNNEYFVYNDNLLKYNDIIEGLLNNNIIVQDAVKKVPDGYLPAKEYKNENGDSYFTYFQDYGY